MTICRLLAILLLILRLEYAKTSELLNIHSPQGFLNRRAAVGTPIEFNSPLRISDNIYGSSVQLDFTRPEHSEIFGIFPTNVTVGRQFGIFVREPRGLPDSENFMNISLTVVNGKRVEYFNLTIQLEDSTLEAPELEALEYIIPVSYPIPAGVLKKFKVRNAQRTKLTKFQYKLTGEYADLFSVDPVESSDILLLRSRGCSTARECETQPAVLPLLLTVSSDSFDVLPAKTLFLLSRTITPQSPRLKEHALNLTVQEYHRSLPFVRIETETERSDMTYFEVNPPNDAFAVNRRNGVLFVHNPALITIPHLGKTHEFDVILRSTVDQSELDRATVTVHVQAGSRLSSGESLEFDQKVYPFAVAPGKTEIGQVRVNISEARYKIAEGSAAEITIDEKSGFLKFVGPLSSHSRNYTLKVVATADNFTAFCSVQILIAGLGSNPPKFVVPIDFVDVNVNELETTKPIHKFKVVDADVDAKLKFELAVFKCVNEFGQKQKECPKHLLSVNSNGELFMNAKEKVPSLIHLTVYSTDLTHPLEPAAQAQLVINVSKNKRKLDPTKTVQFEVGGNEKIEISRRLPIGTFVHTVRVKPMELRWKNEQQVRYSIDSLASAYFAIDPESGVITTVKSLSDAPTSTNISVTAINSINSAKKTKTIFVRVLDDINRPPVIEREFYEFDMPKNAAKGRLIGVISGLGNGVQFEMPKSEKVYELVDVSKNGRITLKERLDSMAASSELNFFVEAKTNGSQLASSIPIHVRLLEVFDTTVKFEKEAYEATIMENAPVGTFVAKFKLNRRFSSTAPVVVFLLQTDGQSSRIGSVLAVDNTGVLRTSGMTRNLSGKYAFTITAKIGSRNVTSLVKLDVVQTSKCQPRFRNQMSVLYLNVTGDKFPVEETLGRFEAETQTDCPISYELEHPLIRIDDTTGEVHLKSSLSRKMRSRIPLVIKARSGGLFARFSAELRVYFDTTDGPQFAEKQLHFQIAENQKSDLIIGHLRTVHPSSSDKFRLLSQSADFAVNLTTGEIRTRRALDREQLQRHELTVEVIDLTNPKRSDSAMVVIDVLDTNDNSPQFDREHYEVVLDRKTVPGAKVIQISAYDTDKQSTNGTDVTFAIEESRFHYRGKMKTTTPIFEIDSTTGQIRLLTSIRDVTGMFELKVAARDSVGDITHVSYATVEIYVCDLIDIGQFVLNRSPRLLQQSNIDDYLRGLTDGIAARAILKEVALYPPNNEVVVLRILFVQPKSNTVIPLMRIEKQISTANLTLLRPMDDDEQFELVENEVEQQESVYVSTLLIAALAFTVILTIILIAFAIVACYQRRRFNQHKAFCESINGTNDYATKCVLSGYADEFTTYKQFPSVPETRLNPLLRQDVSHYHIADDNSRQSVTSIENSEIQEVSLNI